MYSHETFEAEIFLRIVVEGEFRDLKYEDPMCYCCLEPEGGPMCQGSARH